MIIISGTNILPEHVKILTWIYPSFTVGGSPPSPHHSYVSADIRSGIIGKSEPDIQK
jgi:hypothetical protein